MTSPSEEIRDQAERATTELAKAADEPLSVEPHDDRTKEFRTPGFSRMRTSWDGEEGAIVRSVMSIVDNRLMQNFSDAFVIMNDLFEVVREPEFDSDGVVKVDHFGFTTWARTETGNYIEDWDRLGIKERTMFLYQITTRLVDWEQRSAEAWAEAMYAKGMFEERFSRGFTEPPGKLTVDDRTNRAKVASVEERYFAIFQSTYSRKAEALARSMERLALRLSQTTQ